MLLRAAFATQCKRGIFVHEWVRFVPTLPIDGCWTSLQDKVIEKIRRRPVFQTWESRSLRHSDEVKIVPNIFLHEDRPLLPDMSTEVYLAPEYPVEFDDLLLDLGVKFLSWDEMLDRVELDMKSKTSTLRTTPQSDA